MDPGAVHMRASVLCVLVLYGRRLLHAGKCCVLAGVVCALPIVAMHAPRVLYARCFFSRRQVLHIDGVVCARVLNACWL